MRALESYRRISKRVDEEPAQMRFLTDTTQELDAARSAWWQTALIVRELLPMPGAARPPASHDFRVLAM